MFHPTRLRVYLFVLDLMAGNRPAAAVKQDEPRTGSTLVDCPDITSGHSFILSGRF
jgi:hypothetical protein